MESMDKLSLELLTNRRQYRKYLDKIDPKKFEETEELRDNSMKYRPRIIAAMNEYLYDNTHIFNEGINEILPSLIRQFVRYFESKDMEEKAERRHKGWQMDGPDEEDEGSEDEVFEEEGFQDEGQDEGFEEEGLRDEGSEDMSYKKNAMTSGQGVMKSYWGKSCVKKI